MIEDNLITISIIPNIFNLKTNVKFIPHFILGPFMVNTQKNVADILFTFIVNQDVIKPSILDTKIGYFWGKNNEKKVYYEHPFFGKWRLKMLVEKRGNNFTFNVNKIYYKWMTFLLERVWSSGLHLHNTSVLSLANLGYTVAHGACISKNNRGVLIFGSTKIGKTFTAFSSINKGYVIVSEDYLVLNSQFAYATPSMSSKFLQYHSTTQTGWKKYFYNFISDYPIFGIAMYRMLPSSIIKLEQPASLDMDQFERVKIEKICILENSKEGIRKISANEALRKILLLNSTDSFYYNDALLSALSYFNSDIDIKIISEIKNKILSSLTKKIPCFLICAEDPTEYARLIAETK